MVQQRSKTSRSLAVSENGSEGARSKDSDQVYCVVLHVAEAINFVGREASEQQDQIMMNAALNTVDFDVEGSHSAASGAIVFNSNCIWECDLAGIKRIKTDHRPVKLTFSVVRGCSGVERKTIGSLLLPLRGLPVLSTTSNQNGSHLKMIWHKLICISSELRSQKPEVLLVLAIIKKSILHSKDFDHLMQFSDQKTPSTMPLKSPGHSITASMLQSQANIYVQSLMQLGLLQVGNDPLIDCDIIEVVLQLKQLRKVNRLVKWLNQGKEPSSVVVMFDFVGNVTNIELKLNDSDSYAVNDVLGLRFKTSLRSMRLYFQRIFYLPFNMYMNGIAIANYRMDFNNLLPPDSHFNDQMEYSSNGSFVFNRIGRQDSARDPKPPQMEYTFTVEIKNKHSAQDPVEPETTPLIANGGIRELPTNRQDTEAISLSHGQHGYSVASLNVGAELSISEESRGSFSIQGNESDFDIPTDFSRKQNKRRKFTRLTGKEHSLESEDEPCLERKCSKLVREELEEEFPAHECKNVEMEEEVYNRKAQKCVLSSSEEILEARASRSSKLKSASEELLLPKKLKVKAKVSKLSVGESSQPKLMTAKNVKAPLKEHYYDEVTSLEQLEQEEKRLEEEIKMESAKRTRIKSGQSTKYANAQLEEHEFDDFSESTSLQQFELEEKLLAEEDKLESTIKHRINVASNENLRAPTNQKVRKSKRVSKEAVVMDPNELQLNEALMASSSECIPETKLRKKYVKKVSKTKLKEDIGLPQESFNKLRSPELAAVPDIRGENSDIPVETVDNFLTEQLPSSREKLCKKPKTVKIVKKKMSVESVDLTDQNVSCKRRVRSKTLLPEDRSETSISTQGSLGIAKAPKPDLALRARWVEVNKVQSAALEETELYLEQTCQTELHEILYEDQLALGLAQSPSPKNKVRTDIRTESMHQVQGDRERKKKRPSSANIHAEFKTSEEFFSLTESPVKSEEVVDPEIKQQPVRVLKKKKTKQTIVEEAPSVELNECLEEQVIKPIKRKVIRKKVIVKNKDHSEILEPQEELVTVQTKKIIRSSKPVADQPSGDVKVSKNLSSRSSAKSINPRGSHSLDDFDMDHSADTETVGQRIRSWRIQQIERFEEELARKEEHYKAQLEELEYQELKILQQNQEDPAEDEIEADNSVDYQAKFSELEQHILQLKVEMEQQVKLFESRSLELREENLQLANEKAELKARIANMEEQITQLRTQGSDEADLKEVIGELKTQNTRYLNVARQKDRYKKQWRRCARRVHALKLAMYVKNTESHLEANTINLREVLTKDALAFEQEYGPFRCTGTSDNISFTSLSGLGDAPDISQSISQSIAESISQTIFQSSSQFGSHSASQSSSLSGSQTIQPSD